MATYQPLHGAENFPRDAFDIRDLESEIAADQTCLRLLQQFFQAQVEQQGIPPVQAGANARGADYFLREFIIADRRENLLLISPVRVRQFAGNWYIISNLEPDMSELVPILNGVATLYRYLAGTGHVSSEQAGQIELACGDHDYYARRIEEFWAIQGDGFQAWNDACPVK